MLDKLEWHADRARINDVTFLLEGVAAKDTPLDGRTFWLHKDRNLIAAYERIFADYPGLSPRRVLELGIWKGGSAVLWAETLQPEKYVALDILDAEDHPGFRQYLVDRGLVDRVRTYWKTDQGDQARLREIVANEFDGPLDLVIDDASHAYQPTRRSFEVLFPHLRPGGVYVVEDWAWHFSPEIREHFPADEPGLFQFISDLALLMVIAPALVPRVDIRRPFVVVERGDLAFQEAQTQLERFMNSAFEPPRETPLSHLRRLRRSVARAVKGARR